MDDNIPVLNNKIVFMIENGNDNFSCICALLDENHNVIHEACCYVPKILAYLDKEQHYGFGDYIILSIDADGHLKDFPQGDELKKLLDDFINTKSF